MKVIQLNSFSDLVQCRERVIQEVQRSGSVIIRGLFDRSEVRDSLATIHLHLDAGPISPSANATRESVRKNSIRWSIGGFSGAQVGNARLMVAIYNPLSSDDCYDFHKHFYRLIHLRDCIRDDGKSTKDEHLEPPSFNACRFQLYPKGGGFMLGHKDSEAEKTSKMNHVPLLQILLFVTERGLDYSKGGAFLVHNGKEIDLEAYAQSGDVAIYDGNSFHGVRDVDPHLLLDTQKIRGRIVALVTIYK